ncbi:Gfo/Idh/MocA family oxidoreductase [Pseudarthrobacter sp. R1]|uniref:Gfo/Idh/MocA family protein n=1 Tax=Pseudarthrobacter sp. R1 TaxID=2944934 RepID=UPI00210DAD11|nr:Gfo/Idh/MocA family oxidoreductase [Pseudarthrobacter sp. R1]MCQ6271439.1 Gfo/Idh/MocA family oxidoreductase [Pseudarthrobacter sp. R1]
MAIESDTSRQTSIRVGVLGAANIVKEALLRPSARVEGIEVVAIAARDPERAARYAARHGIGKVHASYSSLLDDRDIDAVYIPLPSALHAQWMTAALEAGKHILCEKPFTSNAAAAEEVASAAATSSVVLMEAYHSHYHPLRQRLHDIIESGELGDIWSATAIACAPIPPGKDIRWNFELGGGGLLDLGYYPLRLLRDLFGEVTGMTATAKTRGEIDACLEAQLTHAGGVRSTLLSSIWSRKLLASRLEVQGSQGRMRVGTPTHPQLGGRIRIDGIRGSRVERPVRRSTFDYQLEAFRDAIRGGAVQTGAREAVAQLRTIDALYQAAGLSTRPSSPARAHT